MCPAAWVGAAVAVVGAASSYQQGQNAQDAADEQNQRVADSARTKEERFNKYYGPIEQQLADEVSKGFTADYAGRAARIHADVGAAFDKTREIGNREQSRYGIGQSQDYNKDIDIARALSEVDATNRAYTDERTRADTQGFDRKLNFLKTGYGLPSESTSLYAAQAQNNQNQAAAYGKDAAAGIGAAANIAGQYIRSRPGTNDAFNGSPGSVDTSGTNLFSDRSPGATYGEYGSNYGALSDGGTNLFANANPADYSATSSPYYGEAPYGTGFAEGGPVVARTPSQMVSPDAIPASLTHGEFVHDKDTVAYYGLKHMNDLKMKAKEGMAKMYGPQMASA